MLKALIIGADAVAPEYILAKPRSYPTLGRMITQGASGRHSAFVQKGYAGSYSSEQNWSSIYTGLSPQMHEISTNLIRGECRRPRMDDYAALQPFWDVLNKSGLTIGLWAADCCPYPVEVDSYAVSIKYDLIATPAENRESPREIHLHTKDQWLGRFLTASPPPRLFPQTLKQQGYSFEELRTNPDKARDAIEKYHFQDSLKNFEEELEYFFSRMRAVQREHPTNILYFFTPTTDLIAHCCMHCDDNDVLIKAYQLLDRYIGELIAEFNPELTVVLSDHGMQNFRELIHCSDHQVQREAFSARDEVIWLDNGYIAFEAHNGALLFTAHSLNGVFLASGEGIRNTSITGMRIVDVYPTLLEMLRIEVPAGREGFVMDIFDRPAVNAGKLLKTEDVRYESIALIQAHEMSVTDIILNELYIESRFANITVVGEAKYEEMFRNNPRVSNFLSHDMFNPEDFEKIYCGFYNASSKHMAHVRVL